MGSGADLLHQLVDSIDAHTWSELPDLLHQEFVCRYVHTGETFDRDQWVRTNAEYPGFERMTLQDLVADGDRAVARTHVSGVVAGQPQHFEVAMFVTARDGLIAELTEVWTDVGQQSPRDVQES